LIFQWSRGTIDLTKERYSFYRGLRLFFGHLKDDAVIKNVEYSFFNRSGSYL
jgi:hypothetical protein